MIALIASDLDGTLLGPDGTIPRDNVEAVRAAHAAGIPFVVATGRPTRWLACLEPIADVHPYVIASNGAVVYDLAGRRVLRQHAFTTEQVRAIVERTRAVLPDAVFGLERGDVFGTEPHSPSEFLHDEDTLLADVDGLIEQVTPAVKVLVYSRDLSCDALTDALAPGLTEHATVTSSLTHDQFGMVELSLPGVTKALVLDELARDLGVSAADAVAFGDMPNDLAMLEWAGRGYAMADAHPTLTARFPTAGTAAEGGVGQVLRTLLSRRPEDREGPDPVRPGPDLR